MRSQVLLARSIFAVAVIITSTCPLPLQVQAAVESTKLTDDNYLWLEDVSGDKALNWVRQRNAVSTKELEALPNFKEIDERLLTILNSKEQIPSITKIGNLYYNFWRDEKYVRGIWRRTTMDEYRKKEPAWETVLDLDELAKQEKENWVWHGYDLLKPEKDRCLVSLSRGGTDADVVREFDLTTKSFVKDGFNVPEAKNSVTWRNRDEVYIGTDFGPNSMTSSGYPRLVKLWKRGTPLSSATQVFEGKESDVSVSAYVSHDHGFTYEFLSRAVTFFTDEMKLRQGEKWVDIEKPADCNFGTYLDYASARPRTDWKIGDKTYKAGSLLLNKMDDYLKGDRKFEVLFEPDERKSLDSFNQTKNYAILTELDNVQTKAYLMQHKDGQWTRKPLETPVKGTVSAHGVDSDESDDYFMYVSDFLTPRTLYLGTAGKAPLEKLKSMPAFFKTDGLEIKQFEAKSKDGTRVPYFQVSRKDLKLDGTNPTLVDGYGGFEVSLLSDYDASTGAAWIERGGVYVLANIRGGGEFGPGWHNAARKENRQRAYEDFIAISEDLIARKVTSSKHLGIEGRSNGGLLMGVMLTQRPDLFGAIHCGSPLLDMKRFNHLLAGASWMDEYGDPDKPDEWAYISKYSPYQNIRKDKKYPPILITTSTKDDRVHPGHARKMVARLEEVGAPVLYYENIEGGHGAAANKKQAAFMDALAYAFFWKHLK